MLIVFHLLFVLFTDTSPVVVCEFDSMTYVDGESWDVDHCIHCMCHEGRVGCSVPDCPGVLNCDKPYLPVGECCPKCPTGNVYR